MKRILISLLLLFSLLASYGQEGIVKEYDYDYYKAQFEQGTRMRNAGIALVIAGPVFFWGGIGLAAAASTGWDIAVGIAYAGIAFAILAEVIGIPLWISGGSKRSKSKKEMERLENIPQSSLGFTRDGLGLCIKL